MKKLFTLFLALVASVSAIYAQSGTCGNNLTWTLSNGTLTISGIGAMEDYEYASDAPWDDYRSSIQSLVITDGVTNIGDGAFSYCSSLTSVTIPNSVTSIGDYAFSGCKSLTSITIPNSVTSIGNLAFSYCSSLTSITIPNSVTSIGNHAFSYCSSLISVTIPNSVASIGEYAFYCCSSLTSINVDANNPNYCSIDGVLFGKDKTTLIQYPIGNTRSEYIIPNSVTSIGEWAFSGCKSLTSITIGNSVTSIGDYAFFECSSLTSMTIPNSVTSIGDHAFQYCTYLTSVTIGNGVTSIGDYAFRDCSSLISVTIPNSVASIGDDAFYRCTSLTSVTIGKSVTSIGNSTFRGCSSLTSITIPNSVTSIGNLAFEGCSSLTSSVYNAHCFAYMPTSYSGAYAIPEGIKQIAGGAFYGCSSLASVTIPNSVTSIGDHAFQYCTYLTSVTIGNGVTSIGDYAFRDCSSLISVTIPNSVASIGDDAFYRCTSLTSVTIPNSVTSIGEYAFYYCSSLTSVTNYATQPQAIVEYDFGDVDLSACQLYVPSTSVDLYKTAEVWKDFGNIRPIRAEDITDVSETIITPSENEVEITWPSVSGAASYELVIKDKDGNIVCTLIFNANGQLISIAFNAPSRNGVPAQTQNAGFSFTITGLDSGTGYDLTLTAKDNSGNAIQTETISFVTTGGNVSTDIDQLQGHKVQSTKVIKDGQVLILRNGKTYTMQGQEVK